MNFNFLKEKRFWKRSFLAVSSILIVFIFTAHYLVSKESANTYSDVDLIQKNEVGLLLGTSKFVSNGNVNAYYQYRINATVKLYNAGKIKYVLISGDNGTVNYDEPTSMKNDLIAAGIPTEAIYLDYAGFRTLDSVIRAQKVFGQSKFTIISQPFHNERALYIAHSHGLDAVGFNAKKVGKSYGVKTQMREYMARCKMMIDLTFNKGPKFLGEPIKIGE